MIKLIKTEMKIQKTFNEFLGGKTLPLSCCNLVMEQLVDKDTRLLDYTRTVERVKNKLNSSKIKQEENVLYVDFPFLHANEERPVLVRLLNMKYGNGYFIVVNMREVVYVPAGCKNTHSGNELEQWLSEVTEKHLARIRVSERKLKVKNTVERVKSFFSLTKKPIAH